MAALPAAGRVAIWGNAALSGATSLDEAAEQVADGHPPHRVHGIPGETTPVSLTVALGRLRVLGAHRLRLVLPVPGDVSGLGGPPRFNQRAVEAGEVVLTTGRASLGLLPVAVGRWEVHDVAPPPPASLSLSDAHRMLRQELRECTADLVRLDVARWRPEVRALLQDETSPPAGAFPATFPAPALHLLALAQRIRAVVDLASHTEGGAVTAGEVGSRAEVLARLGVAVRRATEAACNDAPGAA